MRLPAATLMTFWQLAGLEASAGWLSLPAATTTTAPWLFAVLMADWKVCEQASTPPRLRLMTRAGLGLISATPATGAPAAQSTASVMSET